MSISMTNKTYVPKTSLEMISTPILWIRCVLKDRLRKITCHIILFGISFSNLCVCAALKQHGRIFEEPVMPTNIVLAVYTRLILLLFVLHVELLYEEKV